MTEKFITLDLERPWWERCFYVAPLIVVGTKEVNGEYNLAPKHMATPLGWSNYFGFVCTPRHRTYQNICRERAFTVSFPATDEVIMTSLAAAPRDETDSKPSLAALPTQPATIIDGVFLQGAYLNLECELEQIIDGFGENSLIAGKILAVHVLETALRLSDLDDQDLLRQNPLLAYLSPGRYAKIAESYSFPFHQ
ncbi:MAG: flavin reductase family protein, partial [Xenococcus sp. (in: cyanobacteria)]